jgi:hypothetical protein
VVGRPKKTCNARPSALRVYTLDDGTEWTVESATKKINKRWKVNVTTHMTRARLNKSTNPEVIFKKPISTKPRTILTTKEEDIARQMMNLALKKI